MIQQSYTHIRLRRDIAANWTLNNPVLKVGEPGIESDTRKIKFGDGITNWRNLPYAGINVNDSLLLENIDDRVSALIKSGSNIAISYNDAANELTISAVGLQLAGDYATLVNGKVPASQLPSYVDDVLEFASLSSFPAIGENDKIYVAIDNNKTYRWSGSTYVEISASPGSTDAVPEGSVNKYYTDARASAAAPVQSVSGRTGEVALTKSDVGLENVDNTSDLNKPVSIAQAAADNAVQSAAAADASAKANAAQSAAAADATAKADAAQAAAAIDATTKANNAQTYSIQRSNHTGTQAIGTVDGLQSALDSKSATNHTHDDRYYTESEVDSLLSSKQPSGDYATLVNGTVPSAQLPSYIDDVVEAANFAALPATGESGKIYVTLDSNKTYRWSGSTYVEISASPGSTDAVPEGSVNKYYTDARASAAAPVQSVSGRTGTVTLTKNDVGLVNVDNTSDLNKPVSTAQAAADTAVQNAASVDATTKANAAQAYAIQRDNHTGTQDISTINNLQGELDSKANNLKQIYNLTIVNNKANINYDIDREIQKITLDGSTDVNFLKGTGWPSTNHSVDVLLEINVTSLNSVDVYWDIVDEWYNEPDIFVDGKYLILLRNMGPTIQGHYIGKANVVEKLFMTDENGNRMTSEMGDFIIF